MTNKNLENKFMENIKERLRKGIIYSSLAGILLYSGCSSHQRTEQETKVQNIETMIITGKVEKKILQYGSITATQRLDKIHTRVFEVEGMAYFSFMISQNDKRIMLQYYYDKGKVTYKDFAYHSNIRNQLDQLIDCEDSITIQVQKNKNLEQSLYKFKREDILKIKKNISK